MWIDTCRTWTHDAHHGNSTKWLVWTSNDAHARNSVNTCTWALQIIDRFSRSYSYSMIGYWHHDIICLSVCLTVYDEVLNDTSYSKSVWRSEQETISQLSTPCTDVRIYPNKFSTPKFRRFYLLCLASLITWPFCLCCYEHSRALLLRWPLINVTLRTIGYFSNSWPGLASCLILIMIR